MCKNQHAKILTCYLQLFCKKHLLSCAVYYNQSTKPSPSLLNIYTVPQTIFILQFHIHISKQLQALSVLLNKNVKQCLLYDEPYLEKTCFLVHPKRMPAD